MAVITVASESARTPQPQDGPTKARPTLLPADLLTSLLGDRHSKHYVCGSIAALTNVMLTFLICCFDSSCTVCGPSKRYSNFRGTG